MIKELVKAIKSWSRLQNIYLNEDSGDSKTAYKKQRKYCVIYCVNFANINIFAGAYDKKFWKNAKLLFSDRETVNLAKSDIILSNNQRIGETFINYFNSTEHKQQLFYSILDLIETQMLAEVTCQN